MAKFTTDNAIRAVRTPPKASPAMKEYEARQREAAAKTATLRAERLAREALSPPAKPDGKKR